MKSSLHMLFQFRVTPLTPFIIKVTSQSDEMPDSTVLRAARTSSVNNLKTISRLVTILPTQTLLFHHQIRMTSDLRTCSLNFQKTRNSHNIPGPYKIKVQCRRIPLIWIDHSWAKALLAPCVIYARMHSHFKQAGRNKKRFFKRTLTCSGVSLFMILQIV